MGWPSSFVIDYLVVRSGTDDLSAVIKNMSHGDQSLGSTYASVEDIHYEVSKAVKKLSAALQVKEKTFYCGPGPAAKIITSE